MKKIYVLDTNVILHDPKAIFSFEDNQVIIPMVVIEEVDEQKKRHDSVGRNARLFSTYLDQLREKGKLWELQITDRKHYRLIIKTLEEVKVLIN